MKKLFIILATIFSLSLSSCSTNKPETTVNNFMQAMEEGDLKKASTYFDSKVSDEYTNIMGALSNLNLDPDMLKSIQTSLLKAVFQKHKIIDTNEISPTQKEVTVEVTGINAETITVLIQEAYNHISLPDLLQIYTTKGEIPAVAYVMDQVKDLLKEQFTNSSSTYQMRLTLDKKDKDWIITNIK